MRRPNNKRLLMFPLLLAVLLVLGGWGQSSVELLETGLIDLNKALTTAPIGVTEPGTADGSEEEQGQTESGQDQTDDPAASADGPEAGAADAEPTGAHITLRIRGKDIYLGQKKTDEGSLRATLEIYAGSGRTVQLLDDYADAKVYLRVRALLEDLKTEAGLEYEES